MPSPVRSVERLAVVTAVLLLIMAAVSIAGCVACVHRAWLYQEVLDGSTEITRDDFRYSGRFVVGPWLAFYLGLVVVGVPFIRWQHRYARNARELDGPRGLGPGWAIGGWFVPLANSVLPGIVLHQASRSSRADGSNRGSWLVRLWMAPFTVGSWVLVAYGFVSGPVNSPPFATRDPVEDGKLANQILAGGFALLVVTAIVGAFMVRSLTRQQAIRLARGWG